MVIALARLFRSRQWNRGFTLIELLIVILIVGILAAVATPLYLGYIKDAKTAEAKAVAGSLWTALQSNAIGNCGNDETLANAYPKAGLSSGGETSPTRWKVSGDGTIKVACADGKMTVSSPVFTVTGVPDDVKFIKVQLVYDASKSPAVRLECNTDAGTVFVPC